jgi:FKBP-type peptidyl-prolyl cis-trans isomerase
MKKISFPVLIAFLFAALMITSCKKTSIEGYTRDASGFYYKLIALGDGNSHPETGNVCVVDAVMKTQDDSVFWDTRHDAMNGLYIAINQKLMNGSCNGHLLKLVEGDSASFLVRPSVFFRDYFDTIVPAFCKNDSLVRLDFKFNQIMSRQEYTALKQNAETGHVEDTELEELQLIDSYLVQHYSFVKPDGYGMYTLEKKLTNLEKVSAGKRIKIAYSGSYLDGKPIDLGEQQLEFVYGTPDQLIEGLNIVIGSLKKAETIKIIVPSRLAFGESGSSNGSIPPYTPLVYNVKIIDIK